jgi:hypothetical protein
MVLLFLLLRTVFDLLMGCDVEYGFEILFLQYSKKFIPRKYAK